MDTSREQTLLKRSIAATAAIGVSSTAFGLWMGSQAIVFDGVFSLADMLMTLVDLAVVRLLAIEGSRRFQYGYWHLEPLVVVFNGAMITLACIYAIINAITGLLGGGHTLSFGLISGWAALVGILSLAMAAYMQRSARALASDFLKLDARGWLLGGSLNVGLLIGFGAAALMAGTRLAPMARYVDSAVLLITTLCIMPLPLKTVWRALKQVLLVAPGALDLQVRTLMDAVIAERGFPGYHSYVTRTGRLVVIEISVIMPPNYLLGSINQLDAMRQLIADRLGGQRDRYWLSIAFTADPKWA